MQLDKLDIKIQEAAKQSEPVFNEQAWTKMEKLLDVQMPQNNNKKKKRLLWLFIFLFLLTGTLFLLIRSGETGFYANKTIIPSASRLISSKNFTDKNKNLNSIQLTLSPVTEKTVIKKSFSEISENTPLLFEINDQSLSTVLYHNLPENKKLYDLKISTPAIIFNYPSFNSENLHEIKKTDTESVKKISSSPDNSLAPAGKNKFSNSFLLNFSLGPDVSAVNPGNIGNLNLLYGIGIGYHAGKKWTIRTGIYYEKKVYSAKPSDYHPPVTFWYNFPDLKSINANCNILEVPLIVNYNFKQTLRNTWFGSVGTSSYFMKKEKYDYLSKNQSGQNYYNRLAISNQNEHYFSSLRLSAGYERKLSNKASLIAEPYLNLPLSGVGYGKVKLYSSGIVFTLSVKPFAKR